MVNNLLKFISLKYLFHCIVQFIFPFLYQVEVPFELLAHEAERLKVLMPLKGAGPKIKGTYEEEEKKMNKNVFHLVIIKLRMHFYQARNLCPNIASDHLSITLSSITLSLVSLLSPLPSHSLPISLLSKLSSLLVS